MDTRTIRITAGGVSTEAELNDARTAGQIWAALPIEAKASSQGNEIRPASAVNVIGRVRGDPGVFRKIRAGTRIVIARAGS